MSSEPSLESEITRFGHEFLVDCRAQLGGARQSLSAYEASLSVAALQPLRHYFHTIAGVAAPVGYPLLGSLAAISEDFIAMLFAGRAQATPHSGQLLNRSLGDIEHFLASQLTEPAAKAPARTQVPPEADLSGKRILIVDDDPLSARLVDRCLTKAGAETRHCKRAEDAVNVVDEEKPDLILMDLVMPGQDGYETRRQIRSRPGAQFIPIIFLTRLSAGEEEMEALRQKGDDYLTKPFEPDLLTRRISAHIARHARESEQSQRDRLTGAFNYRYLKQRMGEELLALPQQRFCLAMLNLDHFRAFNDLHGRAAGDEVLKALVERTNDMMRRTDVVARYGGDLLAVILLEADRAQATRVLGRLMDVVRSPGFLKGPLAQEPLTLSIGVAQARAGESPGTLIERADAALLSAKQRGRNCLVNAEEAALEERPVFQDV